MFWQAFPNSNAIQSPNEVLLSSYICYFIHLKPIDAQTTWRHNHILQRKVSDINNFLESLIKSQKSMVYLLVIITLTIKGFNAYGLHLNRIRSSLFAKYKKFLTTQEINPDYNSVCPVIITSWEI